MQIEKIKIYFFYFLLVINILITQLSHKNDSKLREIFVIPVKKIPRKTNALRGKFWVIINFIKMKKYQRQQMKYALLIFFN